MLNIFVISGMSEEKSPDKNDDTKNEEAEPVEEEFIPNSFKEYIEYEIKGQEDRLRDCDCLLLISKWKKFKGEEISLPDLARRVYLISIGLKDLVLRVEENSLVQDCFI